MEFSDNEFKNNSTVKFLFPILKKYGYIYTKNMDVLYKQGVFCFDLNNMNIENCLFVVVNVDKTEKSIGNKNFDYVMNYFLKQDFCKKIYILDVFFVTKAPKRIVLVLEIPEANQDAVKRMIDGDFGGMYNIEDISSYFKARTDNRNHRDYFDRIRRILTSKQQAPAPKIEDETLGY